MKRVIRSIQDCIRNIYNLLINESGLTLFEVVVAVTISSLILIMVYSSHSSITKAIYELTGIADFYENINLAIRRIDKDISCAYFNKDNKEICFIGESNYETPYNGKLNFVTVDHKDFSMLVDPGIPYHESDIKEIGYFLEPDIKHPGINFLIKREESFHDDQPESGGEYNIILENVVDLKFEFRQGNTWTNNWDSRENKKFPKIIKTTLTVKNYNKTEEIYVIISKVNINQ